MSRRVCDVIFGRAALNLLNTKKLIPILYCPNMVLKFGFTFKIYLGTTSIVHIKNAVIFTDFHFHVGVVKNSFQIKV